MADESEQQAAEKDVTAASEGYGGPVSDQELADVYLPEGQDTVQDTDSRTNTGSGQPDAAPDGSGTIDGSSGEPAIEPPD